MSITIDDVRERATITVAEAAELLGVTKNTAHKYAKAGDLPVLQIGRRQLVKAQELLRMLGAIR